MLAFNSSPIGAAGMFAVPARAGMRRGPAPMTSTPMAGGMFKPQVQDYTGLAQPMSFTPPGGAPPTGTPPTRDPWAPPSGDPAMNSRDIAAGQWWGMEFNGPGKGNSPTWTVTKPTDYEVVLGGDLDRGITASIPGVGVVHNGQIIHLAPGTYQALLDAQHAGGTSFMLNSRFNVKGP